MFEAVVIVGLILFGALIAGSTLLVAWKYRFASPVARAEAASNQRFKGIFPSRGAQAIEALLERLNLHEHRLALIHPVTGLPTREPLAVRMTDDRKGTLAIVALEDYDRLCAFDPARAEWLLLKISERISAMVPSSRLVAQIDRSHLAVWIGPDVAPAKATREIEALKYALGDRLVEGEKEIMPQVITRKTYFQAGSTSPHLAIAQTLSLFSVPVVSDLRTSVTSINLEAQARERFELEQDLRHAIPENQLRMQYQPLVDATRGQVVGAEALVRWQHPRRGLVPPSQFIPIAETSDLANELGLWILNQAARDARSWLGCGVADFRVAVNIAGHQLASDDLALLIERTLERHGLEPSALEVELTESVALADDSRASALCARLRKRGVKVALDDFGTGYSSLSSLRNLGFDKLKIDRAFVTDVDTRRDNQAICSSILALGRGLGIVVLAEGVESRDEYVWLRRQGCRHFQGYYFSHPLNADNFWQFARNIKSLADKLHHDDGFINQRVQA